MKATFTRDFYRPCGSTSNEVQCLRKDSSIELYYYNDVVGDPAAIMFTGKKQMPLFNYSFKTVEERDDFVDSRLNDFTEAQNRKIAREKARKEATEAVLSSIKVGDIYINSFGYSMTIVHFYQVTAIKGKTITIEKIQSELVDGNSFNGQVNPIKDSFTGDKFNKRVNKWGIISPNSGYMRKWEGKSVYFNTLD